MVSQRLRVANVALLDDAVTFNCSLEAEASVYY
jgi:hypothetical protein